MDILLVLRLCDLANEAKQMCFERKSAPSDTMFESIMSEIRRVKKELGIRYLCQVLEPISLHNAYQYFAQPKFYRNTKLMRG